MGTTDIRRYNGNDTTARAKEAMRSTVATVQENVQTGLAKAQQALLEGLGAAQDVLQGQQKRAKKKVAKNAKKARENMKNLPGTARENVQPGLAKMQNALLVGMAVTQEMLGRNVKLANENLKRASRNLKSLQGLLQENVQLGLAQTQGALSTGLSTAQVTLSQSAQRAGEGLKKAQGNIKVTTDSLQSQLESYKRKRRRARVLFRLGMLSGIVLMLLYTPWPGSETRRQIVEFWQGLFPRQS